MSCALRMPIDEPCTLAATKEQAARPPARSAGNEILIALSHGAKVLVVATAGVTDRPLVEDFTNRSHNMHDEPRRVTLVGGAPEPSHYLTQLFEHKLSPKLLSV